MYIHIYIYNAFVLSSKAYLIKDISYSLGYFAYSFKTYFGNPWITKKQMFFSFFCLTLCKIN